MTILELFFKLSAEEKREIFRATHKDYLEVFGIN